MNNYQSKIDEIHNSKYGDKIKERLINHYTNLQKALTKANHTTTVSYCGHYNRTFDIVAPCCNGVSPDGKRTTYPCRLCHDAVNHHTLDRHKIAHMKCRACRSFQQISASCQNPQCYLFQREHRYSCTKCNLFDNNPRDIFHCDQCNICRVGKREDYMHCAKCNMCVRVNSNHQCVSSTNDNCFVCNEDLFSSREPITTLPCGHYIHVGCFQTLLQQPHTLPTCGICRKSIVDMSAHWRQIDAHLATETLPEQFQHWKTNIVCNDCHAKSQTNYHFVYHKCLPCGSYNTTIDEVIKGDKVSE